MRVLATNIAAKKKNSGLALAKNLA